MKDQLTRNWLAVGVVWVGVLLFTYMNLQMIQQIKTKQASIESMFMDDAFLKSNFDKITHVLKQRASLHKPIDSLQIELLSLENRLRDVTQKQDLSDFRFSSDQNSLMGDRISLELQVTGTYRDLIFWLQTLETDTPFLVTTGIRMFENKEGEGYRFQIGFIFRFHIIEDHTGSV